MSSKYEIITLGYVFDENIQFADGRKVGPLLGGTVSYSSVVLGQLGVNIGIVSKAGLNISGDLLRPFQKSGVDMTGFQLSENEVTTTNILIYDNDGNKILKYLKKSSPIEFSDIPESYFDTKAFYFCPVDFEVSASTVKKIKSKGILTAADLGGFGGAHVSEEKYAWFRKNRSEIVEEYLGSLDIVKTSMEDCYRIFGESSITEEQAMDRFLDYGAEIVIMTLGEKGSIIKTRKKNITILPIPVKAVDTTGAGDTYTAAFLSEYLNTGDIQRAGEFASATSSILIEKSGGVSIKRIPDRQQVLKRVKYYGNSYDLNKSVR